MSEKEIQNAILREFGARSDMRIWRSAIGVGVPTHGRAPVQFGLVGQADISGIIKSSGRRLEIEVKAADGRLSEKQKSFGAMIMRFGGIWIVARSVQDVYDGLLLAGIDLIDADKGAA